jgi:dihydroneopterin aldolase
MGGWVIKIGGSLAGSPALRSWLSAATGPRKQPLVIVPGGGPFADAVRRAQAEQAFDDRTAHRMALLAMEQYGLMLCALAPGLVPAASTDAILAAQRGGEVPVWMAAAMTEDAPGLAPNWDTTSDSLAAWLARRIGAKVLLLVKSAAVPKGAASAEDLARCGLVDPAFPALVRGGGFAVHCLGPGDRDALARGLAEGLLPGLAVATG